MSTSGKKRGSAGVQISDAKTLEMFVVRARRVTEHSLFRDRELFWKVYRGTYTVGVTYNRATDEESYVLVQQVPSEELLESLAARIRPLLLGREHVYFDKVLNALERLVPADQISEVCEPLSWWRQQWECVYAPDDEAAMAYKVITEHGEVTDRKLMDRWVYGDLVHNDDIEADTLGLDIEQRYKAAVGVVIRIAHLVERMLTMIQMLVERGQLALAPDVFSRQVVVTKTVFETPVVVRLAEVGAEVPNTLEALDPTIWQRLVDVVQPVSNEESDSERTA